MNDSRLHVKIPAALKAQLEEEARLSGVSVAQVVRDGCRLALNASAVILQLKALEQDCYGSPEGDVFGGLLRELTRGLP